jgi:hypothetical protein
MLNHNLAWFDGEHCDALYQTSAFLLQDSVGHRNRPLNHFGSFVSWMPGYHGGRCSRPFKVTVPNLVRLIQRVHILPSLYSVPSLTLLVHKRAYLARCDLTFLDLFVCFVIYISLKALTLMSRRRSRYSACCINFSYIEIDDYVIFRKRLRHIFNGFVFHSVSTQRDKVYEQWTLGYID